MVGLLWLKSLTLLLTLSFSSNGSSQKDPDDIPLVIVPFGLAGLLVLVLKSSLSEGPIVSYKWSLRLEGSYMNFGRGIL